MKTRSLFLLTAMLLLVACAISSCKKSSDDDTTATAVLYQAYINGTLWTPTSTNAVLTYNAAAKTKTLTCTAINTTSADKIVFSITQLATAADNTFTAQTYTADNINVVPVYYVTSNGVYTTVGDLSAGSIVITTFDSTNNVMTGTFYFSMTKNNYDGNGNLTSITANAVRAGEFNNLPFTFVKQ